MNTQPVFLHRKPRGIGKHVPFPCKLLYLTLSLAGLAVPFSANAFNIYLEDTTLVTQSGIWRTSRSSVGTDVSTTCSSVTQADHYINNQWIGGASGGQFTNGGATTGPAQLTYWRDGAGHYLEDRYWIGPTAAPRTYTMRLFPLMADSPNAPYSAMCDAVSIPVLETALTLASSGNFGKVASDHFSIASSAAATLRWLIVEKGSNWIWATDSTANFEFPYPKTLSDAVTGSASAVNVVSCSYDGMMGGMMCSDTYWDGSGSVPNTPLNIIASGSTNLVSGANTISFDSSVWDPTKHYVLYAMVDDSAGTSNYGRTYYQELTYAVSGPALSAVSVTATGTGTTANLVATSSAGGNGYWVVIDGVDATAPSASQIKAGQNSDGATTGPDVIASGSAAMTGGAAKTFSLTGLTANSGYTVCLVSNDGSNDSSVSCQNLTTGPAFSNLSPADGSYLNANYSVGYTLNENLNSGSLVFTRTGGSADPGSPHTCTLNNDNTLLMGAHTIAPHTTGCVSPVTLVDGAIYDVAFNGADAAGLSSAITGITGLIQDVSPPTAATSNPISGAKGSMNTVNTSVYEAQDVITITFSEPVLANFGITSNAPTVSNGHSLGSPIITAVSPVSNYATTFTITLGSMGLSLVAGDTLTFTASHVEDRAGNLATGNVIFTVPAPTSITAPAAPTGLTATAGDGQATVAWVAPTNIGSAAITGYTVTSSPGDFTCTTTGATTCVVSGLDNGTSYTFTATATNGAISPASAASSAVTPMAIAVPDDPTGITAIAGNGAISVAFSAPANNGGAAISEYTASCAPDGVNQFAIFYAWTASQTGTNSPITVNGLTNGTSYKCEVKARNSVGYSHYSVASNAATPVAPVVTDNTPSAPTNTTLPTGGGTVTPTSGQTVTVTDNGGNGSTINLPTPPSSGTPGTGATVTVALPGTGNVAVSNNTAGTQLQVQSVTLPGSSTPVSTVQVSTGSATLVASGAGQTLVTTGISNGLTVTSGASGTSATVTASGNTQSIALTGTANLTLGSSLDTQRTTVTLTPTSSGTNSQANLNIGGQTLSVSTSGGNTQLQVVPTTVTGQRTNAIVVTGGSANITGQSGQVMNVIPTSTGTCTAGTTGGYFEARSNNAQSNVLSVNQGNLALTGYIPQGVVAYHYTSSACNGFAMATPLDAGSVKEVLIYQGEYVEVDKNGQPTKIVVRSKDGKSGAAGDPIQVPGSSGLAVDTVIPGLNQNTGRLPAGQTIAQNIESLIKLYDTSWTVSRQDTYGALRLTNSSGDKYAVLPVGQILADPERQDGVQCYGNGLCQITARNLTTSFNAALDAPQTFVAELSKIDPATKVRLNQDGNLQVTLNNRTYLAQVNWNVAPAGTQGFASDASGISFSSTSGKQALYPVLANLDRLQAVIKKIDPSATAQGDHQGTFTVQSQGQVYHLTPAWEVIATPAAHANDDYWLDNGAIYLNYLDGTAQGVIVK